MKPNSSKAKPINRDAIITALRREVEAAGQKRITMRKFLSATGIHRGNIFRHFARWEDALQAAGFHFKRHNELISEALLLEDWGKVVRALKRLPMKNDYRINGKFSATTLMTRLGGWGGIPLAFRAFALDKPQWMDVLALIPGRFQQDGITPVVTPGWRSRRESGTTRARVHQLPKLPFFGARLASGALQHAPVNENGVILLFGAMAERLGFLVEAVRMGFPDCEAKRLVGPDLWIRLRIEFEYESRNFRNHKHPPEGCDMIICWEHNWPDCPKTLEVIALKDELARLPAAS